MTDLVVAAAGYLNAGLPVIALQGKAPHSRYHPHGLHDAIRGTVETAADLSVLSEFFGGDDTTGIGLPLPQLDAGSLVVVDIDGEEGARQWRDLVGDDELVPETGIARTGRGLHLWFLTTRTGQGSRKLGPKLDLRGVGGYVAAPPSLHPDGHRYEWLEPLVVDGRMRVDFLPEPIERLLAMADAVTNDFHIERHVYTHYNLSLQDGVFRLHTELVPPPISGLVKVIEEAGHGNRNNLLAWAVLQARDEGLTMEDAMRELGGAAIRAGLGDREVRTTIRAAYRRSRRDA